MSHDIMTAIPATSHADSTWLPLTEYSVRRGVSLSTIRRKIKKNEIPFRIDKGKYLILFDTDAKADATHVPRAEPQPHQTLRSHQVRLPQDSPPAPVTSYQPRVAEPMIMLSTPVSAVEKSIEMITEAFEHAIHEKDERISLLEKQSELFRQMIGELRLLVRVLEEKYEVQY